MRQKLKATGDAIYWVYDRTVTGIIYGFLFIIITSITLVILAISFESVLPKGRGPILALVGISTLPGILIFYFWWRGAKWRRENPEAYAAQQAKKEADRKAALKAAKSAPSGPIDQFLAGVISLIGGLVVVGFYIVIGLVVLYLGYLLITAMSVPVAILIGAIIIGFCILAARN